KDDLSWIEALHEVTHKNREGGLKDPIGGGGSKGHRHPALVAIPSAKDEGSREPLCKDFIAFGNDSLLDFAQKGSLPFDKPKDGVFACPVGNKVGVEFRFQLPESRVFARHHDERGNGLRPEIGRRFPKEDPEPVEVGGVFRKGFKVPEADLGNRTKCSEPEGV